MGWWRRLWWSVRRRWFINGAMMAHADRLHWMPTETELDTAEHVLAEAEATWDRDHPHPA